MDHRLIDSVLEYTKGLEIIRHLKPSSFVVKATKENRLGVIAKEVASVEPVLVRTSGGIQHINYEFMVVVLINAIKELRSEIETLKESKRKKTKS